MEEGGLCSQDLKKPSRFGFCFIGNGEPREALEQRIILLRTVLLNDYCIAE